jgi:drug/metabolite transporter (DMT)-like permease
MRTTKRTLAVVMGVLGLMLVVKGAMDGLWPVSMQLMAGVLLVVFAVLRWRTL